ncbi:MAG: carbohydrate ABC transporter permease [Solirubrobacterales bacterium]
MEAATQPLPAGAAAPPAPRVARRPPRSVRRKKLLITIADHSILIVLAIMFLAPFAFILLTSLMTTDQALSTNLWPDPLHLKNYSDVFDAAPILTYGLNSFIYAGLATLGVIISSVPVAYALARLRWRGRNVAFVVVLATMMLPAQVTIVPLYVLFSKLHLVGTLTPLIIPNFLGDAFSIFLLRQFFMTIPEEYADAARVDGAGELRVMLLVVARLAKPAIAAVALFAFLYAWNDFFGPLLYTGENESHWTLSVGLSQFHTIHQVQWNLTMAATLLFMAPVIALFFAAQKAFVEGVTLTGVKG